jgi:hypothetical protein
VVQAAVRYSNARRAKNRWAVIVHPEERGRHELDVCLRPLRDLTVSHVAFLQGGPLTRFAEIEFGAGDAFVAIVQDRGVADCALSVLVVFFERVRRPISLRLGTYRHPATHVVPKSFLGRCAVSRR